MDPPYEWVAFHVRRRLLESWFAALLFHGAYEVLVRAGDDEGLSELDATVAAARDRVPIAVRAVHERLRAGLAVSAGDDAEAERLLREALGDAETWGSAVLAARCRDDLGACLVRQGRVEEAEPYLTAARATYEALAAVAWLRELEFATTSRGVVA
jgi:hypothetical protein